MFKSEQNLTEGSILKNLITFAFPFVFANLLQALYGACDLIIIGHYTGKSASISSIAIGAQVMFMVTSFIIGLTTGTTVLIGHFFGAQKHEEIQKTIGTVFMFFITLSFIVFFLMYFFAPNLINIMQTPKEAYQGAVDYVEICSFGIIFIFLFNAFNSILRGVGNSHAPMMFVSLGCFINIILDLFFIGYLNFGVNGAAIATIIAQGFCALSLVAYIRMNKFSFEFRFRKVKFHFDKIKDIIKLGLPLSFQDSMVQMSFIILLTLANSMGVDASAGYGTANRLNGFTMLPAFSFAMALTPIVAQNIGAKKRLRAKYTLYTAIGCTVVFGFVCLIWQQVNPESAIRIFTLDKNVITQGASYLKSFSFDLVVVPFAFCLNAFFNGCGHTAFSMVNNLAATLLVRVPLAFLITGIFGKTLFNLGIAAPVASICSVIIALIYLKSNRWKKSSSFA